LIAHLRRSSNDVGVRMLGKGHFEGLIIPLISGQHGRERRYQERKHHAKDADQA
jgi:hypothetical protein